MLGFEIDSSQEDSEDQLVFVKHSSGDFAEDIQEQVTGDSLKSSSGISDGGEVGIIGYGLVENFDEKSQRIIVEEMDLQTK